MKDWENVKGYYNSLNPWTRERSRRKNPHIPKPNKTKPTPTVYTIAPLQDSPRPAHHPHRPGPFPPSDFPRAPPDANIVALLAVYSTRFPSERTKEGRTGGRAFAIHTRRWRTHETFGLPGGSRESQARRDPFFHAVLFRIVWQGCKGVFALFCRISLCCVGMMIIHTYHG